MPLTDFAGGEDFLFGASRAGKQGKRQTYAALAELRKQERDATQRMLDEQNKARRENPQLGMGQRFKPAGIERTGPKDITIEDFEAGNISAEDYNDMMSRARGQDPRVTRGLRIADMLGLTSVSRTLFGKDSPFAGAGGMLVGEALRRLMPESNYKYVFDEYGQSVGTSAYTSKPSKTDPLIAAATVTPTSGFAPALRGMMSAAKAFDRVVPRPVTAGLAAAGVAGATMAQPDEAEAANIFQALKFSAGEFGTSRPAFNQYSRVHRALKNAGIYSGDPLYKEIVGTVTNKDAGKMFADFIKKNPTVVDALKREAEQKAKELGVPVEELPPGALRNQLNIMHNPGSEVAGVKSPGFKDAPYSVWGPDVVSVGTKKLNTVTTMAQKELGTIKSYDDVITWAMKNLPEYKGMSRTRVVEALGAKHLV